MKLHEFLKEDRQGTLQDFIISKYQTGEISYEKAKEELRKVLPKSNKPEDVIERNYWELELFAAKEAKEKAH